MLYQHLFRLFNSFMQCSSQSPRYAEVSVSSVRSTRILTAPTAPGFCHLAIYHFLLSLATFFRKFLPLASTVALLQAALIDSELATEAVKGAFRHRHFYSWRTTIYTGVFAGVCIHTAKVLFAGVFVYRGICRGLFLKVLQQFNVQLWCWNMKL